MNILNISNQEINRLITDARNSPRKRAHLNVHKNLESNVQRLFIATEPETYIRPHRHTENHKWEFFTVLRGNIDLLIFDDKGSVVQRIAMSPTETPSVEIPPNTWHTYVCKATGTVALEVKEGPYIPTAEENFAPWAPPEYNEQAASYREKLR